jgi:hypothetical protein
VIALPVYPELPGAALEQVAATVREFASSRSAARA